MGRLTLNILLSFAQFEREVTGERIRDKIAASKKKGIWMGGLPSLGYDIKDKRLVINEAEAKTVRFIFRRYAELKSVRLLKSGILFDTHGERMSPTHATKNNTRYRYYVSRPLLAGTIKHSGQRIPASNLEALVTGRIFNWLGDRAAMLDITQSHTSDATTQKQLIVGLEQCVATWLELKADEVRNFMLSIVARIQVHADRIDILLKPSSLVRWLGRTDSHAEPVTATRCDTEGSFATLSIPARLKRVGKEMKILIEDGSDSASPDASLVRVLVRAHMIRDRFLADKSATLDEIAKSVDIVPSYVTRLFRLTLLAPDIVSAILAGKQPPELNARKLLDDTRLPLDWNEQRRSLGFA